MTSRTVSFVRWRSTCRDGSLESTAHLSLRFKMSTLLPRCAHRCRGALSKVGASCRCSHISLGSLCVTEDATDCRNCGCCVRPRVFYFGRRAAPTAATSGPHLNTRGTLTNLSGAIGSAGTLLLDSLPENVLECVASALKLQALLQPDGKGGGGQVKSCEKSQ